MKNYDYHIHSEYSHDCSLEFEEIIEISINNGLNKISITDHNNIDLYRNESYLCEDIRIMPGLEFTAEFEKCRIDFLFYGENLLETELRFDVLMNSAFNNDIILFIPHPFRNPTGLLYNYYNDQLREGIFNKCINTATGVEILNGKDNYRNMIKSIELINNPLFQGQWLVGSDAHRESDIGKISNISHNSKKYYRIKSAAKSMNMEDIINRFPSRNENYIKTHYAGIYTLAQLIPDFKYVKNFKSKIASSLLDHSVVTTNDYKYFEICHNNDHYYTQILKRRPL